MQTPSQSAETLSAESTEAGLARSRHAVATIVFHPNLARIGEQLQLGVGGSVEVSRHTGQFRSRDGSEHPLDDPFVSRQPVRLAIDWRRGLTVAAATPDSVLIEESPLRKPATFSVSELERGILVTLSRRVVLLIHLRAERLDTRDHNLVGCSSALASIRESIEKVSDLDVPVLLRGETGVGKDMVARAIHAAGGSRQGPYVAVNMGAISPNTAVSELFGHARGAFTGAATEHAGLFERANGGTILLDEIGETPDDVQPMLLRVLETGEYLPVGASAPRQTKVRVIAATDADLEHAQETGAFRTALLHRLSGFEIEVTPLRRRREDIAPLVLHFMRAELERLGETHRLEQSANDKRLWFRAKLMRKLIAFDWPGNVRQLLNAVRQLLIASRGHETLSFDERLNAMFASPIEPPASEAGAVAMRPAGLTLELVKSTLRTHGWAMGPTATALKVPRSSLYDFIEKTPGLRTAKDVDPDALRTAFHDCNGDLDSMSNALEVSKRGIRLRLKEVGLLD